MIKCCKGCEKRHPFCHSSCEIYLQERAELDEVNKVKRLESEYNACAKRLSIERKKQWQMKKK